MTSDQARTFWREESDLMWSRVQTAAVVEAGSLGAWFAVLPRDEQLLTYLALGVGALLLLIVSILMRRDAQYMDACEKIIGDAMPKPGRALFGLKGRTLAVSVPLLLAAANVALIWLY